MAKFLQIAQLGNPILRKNSNFVSDMSKTEISSLIDDMIATMLDLNGVGIAAPQVYESQRIFIISSKPSTKNPDSPLVDPTAIINPEIFYFSDDIEKDWEGCLSIPGIRGLVPRHKSIKVRYSLINGVTVEKNYDNFIARVFQHEFDHLNGIVYLDKLDSTKDIVTEKEYLKLIS